MIIDCLFLHQPLERKDGERLFLQFPIGIFGLADFLEKNGLEVKIVNIGVEKEKNPNFSIDQIFKKNEIKVIALDLHWYINSFNVLKLANKIKKINNCKILLGGITASIFHKEIMKRFEYIDGVIRGDGEVPLLKYIQFQEGKGDISKIPNLTYRNKDGKVKINKDKFVTSKEFMDKISYSNIETLKNWKKYFEIIMKSFSLSFTDNMKPVKNIFYLPVGKGCSVNCSYCGGSNFAHKKMNTRFKKPQFRSLNSVFKDIKKLKEKGIEMFCFEYQPPHSMKNYYEKLFDKMDKNKMKTPLNFGAWKLPNKSFIDKFSLVSIKEKSSVAISPETGSEKIRKINKGIFYSNSQLVKSIKYMDKKDVMNSVYFTVGLPKETKKDFEKTLNLGKYINSNFNSICKISSVPIEPSSLIFEKPRKFDVKIYRKTFLDFYRYSKRISKNQKVEHPLGYETKFLTEKDILDLQAKAYKNFYLNKKFIFSQLKKRKNLKSDFIRNFKILLKIIFGNMNKSPYSEIT